MALALAATVLLMVPWLNPFAPGPSPAFMPWLVTLVCGSLLLLIAPFVTAAVVARAWLAAALLSAAIGLLQYMGWEQPFAPWINLTALGETFGNLRQRNQFASLMNIGLAALLWHGAQSALQATAGKAAVGSADEVRASRNRRGLLMGAAALLGAANAASASRTGLMQLLVLGVLVTLWGMNVAGRRHAASRGNVQVHGGLHLPLRRLVIIALVAYLLASFVLPLAIGLTPSLHGVFARMADNSMPCSSRVTLWGNVLHLISLRPWTGWGWGELDYAHFATLYPGERFCDILDNAHDLPLHLAVELGIPAALVLCGLIAWLVLRARPWRETVPVRQLAWAVLVVIGLHSLLEYPLWYGPFFTAAVLSIAMLFLHRADEGRDSDDDGVSNAGMARRPGWYWRVPVAFLALAALWYVAWDYRRVSQIYTAPEARLPEYRDNTLAKVKASWLFADQVRFAELTMSPVTRENAPAVYAMARASVHYSPEPAVIERLIESAVFLGRDDEAIAWLARYKAAFPKEHEAWHLANLRAVGKAP